MAQPAVSARLPKHDARLPKNSPLPPLQANFTPSEASLEVLQLLNADEGESSEMSEDTIRHTLQEWLRTYDAEQNQYQQQLELQIRLRHHEGPLYVVWHLYTNLLDLLSANL